MLRGVVGISGGKSSVALPNYSFSKEVCTANGPLATVSSQADTADLVRTVAGLLGEPCSTTLKMNQMLTDVIVFLCRLPVCNTGTILCGAWIAREVACGKGQGATGRHPM